MTPEHFEKYNKLCNDAKWIYYTSLIKKSGSDLPHQSVNKITNQIKDHMGLIADEIRRKSVKGLTNHRTYENFIRQKYEWPNVELDDLNEKQK